MSAAQAGDGRRVDGNFKRNIFIIIGVVVVVIGVIALLVAMAPTSGNKGPQTSLTKDIPLEKNPNDITEAQRRKVELVQGRESDEAFKRGETNMPEPLRNRPMDVAPAPGQGGPGASNYQSYVAVNTSNGSGGVGPNDAIRINGLTRQLAALETQAQGVTHVTPAGGDRGQQPQQGQPVPPAQPVQGQVQSVAPQQTMKPVAEGLSIHTAVLRSPIDTDVTSSYISAEIVSGPLKGAFLTGSFARAGSENATLEFRQMRTVDGRFYTADAIALDEQTSNNALSGNVDLKILQRYVYPMGLAVAQAFAAARAQVGNTVVGLSTGAGTGATGVTTPAPTTTQAANAGIAAGLNVLNQDVQRNLQRNSQPRFHLDSGTTIGILFRAPVAAASTAR